MSLPPPPNVQKLPEALHAITKGSPAHRFYAPYDKVHRRVVLERAYVRCRASDGATEVDRQTFADLEAYGRDRRLDELAAERPPFLARLNAGHRPSDLRTLQSP